MTDTSRRLIQPDELKRDEPLVWSPGRGTDVWAMLCAAMTGDLGTIERLVEKDPSLIRASYGYRRPLFFAVKENQLDVVNFLLERGADPVDSGTPDTLLEIARDRGHERMQWLLELAIAGGSRTPIDGAVAAAIRERNPEHVRELLDSFPGLLRAPDERTNRPIHWAVMTRQIDVIDELLARGAEIDVQRADGARPIQLTNGDYHYRGWRDVPKDTVTTPREVLDHLRARGAYVDICTAAYIGDLQRVRALLDEDASRANRPSDYVTYYASSGTPLRNAAAAGHLAIVKLLLKRGADPNLPEESIAPRGHALYSAVRNGHIEIVELLLEHGAHPNVDIESSADALSMAIARGNQPMIDLLCAHGAARSLPLVAYAGDVVTGAAMLAANPALADDPVALANAAAEGHEPFVRLMLRYQPDLPARMRLAPWAVGAATRELNELLFQRGMDPSRADWLRVTPLHWLAGKGDIERAAIFIDHGADLHARDEELSSTPLGYAAKFGRTGMVELLLSRGALTNLPDDPPWATPLAWATRRGHGEVVDLLQRHGAR